MALNPGDTLNNNHYHIVRLLGRGGFGFVYLAQDTLLGEQVAIKELIPALVGDEAMLKRFLTEARATMRLRHKRIVATHNVFQEGGNYYIVMEYMPGGSLEERLRASGPLPVDKAVCVAAEVCEGLACAHEEQVVHCDLKPANILFDGKGQAKVADFGIAHVSGEMMTRSWHTPAGFVAGTLPYMSPEQADGVRDNPRIDVYALGAVLYRMLTGQTYLQFDNQETPRAQMENLQRIYSQQPVAPSTCQARIPAWLDAVILKALAKQPAERYASASEMRAVLLEARQPAVQPAPAPEEAEPPTVLAEAQEPAAPPRQPEPSPPVREVPRRVRSAARAPTVGPVFRPLPDEQKANTSSPHRAPLPNRRRELPGCFWPGVGVAAVLALLVIVAISCLANIPEPEPIIITVTETASPAPSLKISEPQASVASATQTRSKDDMVMVYVPAGEFTMGSANNDNYAYPDQQPEHIVVIDEFWIDRTEVTNAQFRHCVEDGACTAPVSQGSARHSSYYGTSSFDNHPVTWIAWTQAKEYCQWAGARLPTEAEWEKAARGTDGRDYPWGNSTPDCTRANHRGGMLCAGDTSQAGSYPTGASPYGALDMAGNVWEWVADWYDSDYYANSPANNPQGPTSGYERVLRGGSWEVLSPVLRSAYRYYLHPESRDNDFGFRCAADSPGE